MDLNSGVIILLGDQNDSSGELSSVALERCRTCFEVYSNHSNFKILPTGGFGDLSSRSFRPHAYYLREQLLEFGIPKEDILEPALGRNTLENVLLARDAISVYDSRTLFVVTSDFHRRRAQYIFEQLFEEYRIKMFLCHTALPQDRIIDLEKHETAAWDKLLSAPIEEARVDS